MKKPIKYLMNGEYHYATVIDIGDIDKLKTKAKNNLVSAINELYTDGGLGGSGGNEIDPAILEQIEKLENQIELLKKDIGTAGLTESQIKELGDILSKYDFSYYEKLNKEIDEKIEAAKKTVQQSTSEIKEQVSSINKTISSTEKGLEDTKKKLADAELNIVNLESSYDEVTGELSKKVSSTTFDLLETTVAQNTRKIVENEKGIKESIKRSEYDLAQERVAELETLITKTAEGLSTKMTKKELQEEISKISQYKPNLLRNTKDWSGWKGSSEKAKVTEERYQHTSVVTQEGLDYMYIDVDGLEQGKTYVASIWGKSESGISLSFNDGENHILSLENGDTKLSSQWKRYSTKFVAQSSDPHKVYFYSPDNTQTAAYYLAGAKIESGEIASGYIPHIDDIYAKTVDLSNEIKATAEGVELVTQSIEKQNEEIEQNTNSIKNTSKELSQSLKKIKEVGDELEQSKSEWKATAEEIKQKVSSTDLSKIMDGLESQSRNLQRNGSFIDNLNGWTAAKEWKVKDINGVNYASVARTGATKDLDLTLFSDYVAVKKDMKISVGFDMYIKSLAAYNVQKILRIELYDISNKRVDYKDFELKNLISDYKDGNNSRLEAVLKVSREDVYKFRIRFALQQNGDIGVTNVSLRTGSVKDSSWSFAPEDYETIQSKLETEINQTSKKIELKADAEKFDSLTKDYNDNKAKWTLSADKIDSQVKEITKLSEAIEVVKSENSQTAKEIKQSIEKISKDSVSKSEWKLLSDEISGAVKTNKGYGGFKITDKGAILDAEKMYVGIDNQKGFQVVHKDNPTKPILGVSPSGKFEFNALNLDQRFEETNKKIDEIKIGGRNYILKSETFSNLNSNNHPLYPLERGQDNIGNWVRGYHNDKPNLFYINAFFPKLEDGRFYASDAALLIGKSVVLSVDLLSDKPLNIRISGGKTVRLKENTWTRVYGARISTDRAPTIISEDNNAPSDTKLYYKNWKLEKGTKPTDWTPAPEDDRDMVEEIHNGFNNIKIGNRNYIVGTSDKMTPITISGYNYDPNGINEGMIYVTEGEEFVGRVYIKNISSDVGVGIRFFWYDNSGNKIRENSDPADKWIPQGGEGYYTVFDVAPKGAKKLRVTIRNSSSGTSKVEYKELKLEKGNKPSDWSPAPEDFENNIKKVQSNIDGIEFGVKNHLIGTSIMFKPLKIGQWHTAVGNNVHVDKSGFKTGDPITLRAYIKIDKKEKYGAMVRLNFWKEDGTYTIEQGNLIKPGEEGYSTIVTKMMPHKIYTKLSVSFDRQGAGNSEQTNIEYKELKLEKGSKPSDWSPSPEDSRVYRAWSNDKKTLSQYEPKQNLLVNGSFSNVDNGTAGKNKGRYPRHWGGYNGGITNPSTNYHAYANESAFSGFNVVEFNESNGNRGWKGIKQDLVSQADAIKNSNEKLYLSLDVHTTHLGSGNYLYGGMYYTNNAGETTFHNGHYKIYPTKTKEWERFTVEVPFSRNSVKWDTLALYIYGYNFSNNAIMHIKNVSLTLGYSELFLESPYEDSYPAYENVAKYVGFSGIRSDRIEDYEWGISPEYSQAQSEDALKDKVDTNEYENDRDEMFVSLGNKAGIDDLKSVEELANRIQADYEEFIKDGGKYNSDLQAIEDRIAAAVLNLENKVAQLNFINKYIRMGEEGLLIGDSTSLTKILMSDRRISFFDGGKEVAYMEGQEFRINRGTILESLQVGSHKLEQVDKNNTVFTFVR